jgi:starch phosphorylase
MAQPTRESTRRGTPPDLWSRLDALARNLWWTWNPDPQRLFAALDPPAWEATNHNPLAVIAGLPPHRRAALADDRPVQALLGACEKQLRGYLRARPWFRKQFTGPRSRLRVAYFCAEFALHESLPQYAGGLGVLAGDHLKSASDLGVPLVGVGLLYRNGYYEQAFDADGATRVTYPQLDFDRLPIRDTGQSIAVPMGRRDVHAKIWEVRVGRVTLYLLDTDLPDNRPADRAITAHLYGGDQETRIQQEMLLGIGGYRALVALGQRPTVCHLNEGHAALCGIERLREFRGRGMSFDRAVERVRQSTVFTTHTPVPAGHDRFPPDVLYRYLRPIADELGLPRADLLALGRVRPADRGEPFCMTVLALKLAERCNGVSKLHGAVSREMWMDAYGKSRPRDVPITHITNGVHTATWLAPEMRPLVVKHLRPDWDTPTPNDTPWSRADRIPPDALWRTRQLLRRKLVLFIRQRLRQQVQRRCGDLTALRDVLATFDEGALTIGFARRFATYKRAPLIFRDRRRLAAIMNDADRPVQLVFAGKAHPADRDGQAFAQEIYRRAHRDGFRGRVVLLENYDMHVGRMLTAGCDVWLNNPLRPQEASGTSGMKPPLHGGLNCSILDGWWPEAYNRRNGWAIGDGTEASNRAAQDRHDANAIYDLLESEIVPQFYDRTKQGLPNKWIRRMVASMQTVGDAFNTHRMVGEYVELYAPGD